MPSGTSYVGSGVAQKPLIPRAAAVCAVVIATLGFGFGSRRNFRERGREVRIGYLVPEFPSQTHAFFWREIQALRDLGHDVRIISTSRPSGDASHHEFASRAARQTRYLVSLRLGAVADFFIGLRLGKLRSVLSYVARCEASGVREHLRLLALAGFGISLAGEARQEGFDHIHVHSCADAAHVAAVAHVVGGVPFSLTLHGDLPVYGLNHRSKMGGAEFVATVTRPLQEQVCDLMGWPLERVPIIQMGVDTTRFAPSPARPQSDPRHPLQILTVARLNPTKGHLIALEAVRRVLDAGVDARWVIAGGGEARSEIESAVSRLNLGRYVDLVGTVSEERVLELMKAADVFLLPSYGLGEAAPVSVMEAMSCGSAVVSSSIGGTPDMIEDGITGLLVPQRDVDSLVRALTAIAGDEQSRRRLGDAARRHAIAAFDYRTNARHLAVEIGAARR